MGSQWGTASLLCDFWGVIVKLGFGRMYNDQVYARGMCLNDSVCLHDFILDSLVCAVYENVQWFMHLYACVQQSNSVSL